MRSTATWPESDNQAKAGLHARGGRARHVAPAPPARLRFHAIVRIQSLPPRAGLLSLPPGPVTRDHERSAVVPLPVPADGLLSSWSAHDWRGGIRVDEMTRARAPDRHHRQQHLRNRSASRRRAPKCWCAAARSFPVFTAGTTRRQLARRQLPEAAQRARRIPPRARHRARVHHHQPRPHRRHRRRRSPIRPTSCKCAAACGFCDSRSPSRSRSPVRRRFGNVPARSADRDPGVARRLALGLHRSLPDAEPESARRSRRSRHRLDPVVSGPHVSESLHDRHRPLP